jgi:hypothetical protein
VLRLSAKLQFGYLGLPFFRISKLWLKIAVANKGRAIYLAKKNCVILLLDFYELSAQTMRIILSV